MGSVYDLDRLIRILRENLNLQLQGYRYHAGRVSWGEINGIADLPLSVEDYVEPGLYRLKEGYRFRHSSVSPKVFLLPSEQVFLYESEDYARVKAPDTSEMRQTALFGIKPCDRRAIEVLDNIIGSKNPVYASRRKSIAAIIVEECLEPNNNCFCGAVGSGPSIEEGFDVAYARLDEKRVFFKYGSELGRDILVKLDLKPAGEREVNEYREKIESTRELTSRAFSRVMREVQENLLSKARDKDLWLKVSEDCVGCGNCNFVCPTCFCLEFEYSINEQNMGVKTAQWTGCLLYTYGQVAGGHFRPELYTRYRHFVLHKFVFYPKQIGLIGCVGCGRCITWCPMGIDLRGSVNSVAQGGVNAGK